MAKPSPLPTAEKSHSKILLYVAVNLAIILIFGAAIYGVGRVTNDIVSLRSEIAALSLAIAQMVELRAAAEDAEILIAELKRVVPDTEQLLFVSTNFEELALRFGLSFGFNYGGVDEGPPRAILFTMSLTGELVQIMRYINAMHADTPYIMEISNIDVSVGEGGVHTAVVAGKLFIR
jgi:hypothetical protein